jgi:hypothetical protein
VPDEPVPPSRELEPIRIDYARTGGHEPKRRLDTDFLLTTVLPALTAIVLGAVSVATVAFFLFLSFFPPVRLANAAIAGILVILILPPVAMLLRRGTRLVAAGWLVTLMIIWSISYSACGSPL